MGKKTFLGKPILGCFFSARVITDQVKPKTRDFYKCTFKYPKNCKSEIIMKGIHLKIKFWPVYGIMRGFILEANSWEISKTVSW